MIHHMQAMIDHRPTQAVILAGGYGTRLRPLTYTVPKPMIRFHGRPFLEYLIEQVRDQGFERVLLLLGYLPDAICRHFGDGRAFGVSIDYSITEASHETGMRLKCAEPLLDPLFLLMYGDNYWPMDFAGMWAHFVNVGALAQVTVYANKDAYTGNNVRVDERTMVRVYDKTRTADHLLGTDIGYAILPRQVTELIPPANVNFEAAVYPKLAREGLLSAYPTEHRYYGASTHARLGPTASFLERRPAVILDRDGVLNVKPPRGCYVTRQNDFTWIDGSVEAVRWLNEAGCRVLIASNQAGIARGAMTADALDGIHSAMRADLARHGASVDAIYVCPHGWDEGCECRKPKPGMLFAAQRDFHLDLSRTHFVGDDQRDLEAGRRAGCKTHLVSKTRRLIDIVEDAILAPSAPGATCDSLGSDGSVLPAVTSR